VVVVMGVFYSVGGPAGHDSAATDPDALSRYDPEVMLDRFELEHPEDAGDDGQDAVLVLPFQPDNENPRIVLGWIGPNIREVGIQGDQNPPLGPADFRNARVSPAAKILLEDGNSIVARRAHRLGNFDRQIFVGLEFHAVVYAGSATTRSRANSAA